jgi:hypothetical protein
VALIPGKSMQADKSKNLENQSALKLIGMFSFKANWKNEFFIN